MLIYSPHVTEINIWEGSKTSVALVTGKVEHSVAGDAADIYRQLWVLIFLSGCLKVHQ